MKRFKDLKAEDFVYKIIIDQRSQKPEFHKLKVRNCALEGDLRFLSFHNSADMVRVKGEDTRRDYLSRDSFDYNKITRTLFLVSLEELDQFLKEEVEKSREYQKCLEGIYNDAWDNGIEFNKGDVIYVPEFSSAGLYDGEGRVYFFDGEPLNIELLDNLRLATYDEKDELIRTLEMRVSFSAIGLVKERLISVVRQCGWDYKRDTNSFYKVT